MVILVGTGGNFSFRGAIGRAYTLRFDIIPFLDQKWIRLGENFLLGTLLAETRDK